MTNTITPGWKFHAADFSCNAANSERAGYVLLIRDPLQKAKWCKLTEEQTYNSETGELTVPLYVKGEGQTLEEALHDACEKAQKLPLIP